MKQTIPFSKEIVFKTMIGELTDIVLDKELNFTEFNKIEGKFLISGRYKMTEASQIEDNFSEELLVSLDLDDQYDCSKAEIVISDFYYEIINEEILRVHIDLTIDNLVEKELLVVEDLVPIDDRVEQIVKENVPMVKEEIVDSTVLDRCDDNINSIFSTLNSAEETYSTYSVYIVREGDTLDDIMTRYGVTRDDIMYYNDLEDIKLGSKVIIPSKTNV